MKIRYLADDDVLEIRLSDLPIRREVSQGWHTQLSYAADGTLVQIVLLEARQRGMYPIRAASD